MAERREIVACLGSSTTAGRGQAFDWIGELAARTENARYDFRNFGVMLRILLGVERKKSVSANFDGDGHMK